MRYRIEIVASNISNILLNDCLITTVPKGYDVPKERSDIKFINLYFDPTLSFCSTTRTLFDNATAVLTIGANNCGLVQQIRNARLANVKFLLLVSSPNYIYLPNVVNEFNQYPIVILMSSDVFNKISNQILFNNSKIGIYGSMGDNKIGDAITGVLLFSVIIVSVVLIIVITVVFNREHFDGLKSVTTTESKNMKWIVLICPITMVGTLLLLYFFYNVFVWVIIILFYFAVAFSATSFVMLFIFKFNILPHWIHPVNKYGINNIDYRALGIFVFGLALSTSWIVNRNNMIGLVLNNIIGILLCGEIAVGFGILFVATKNFRLLLALLTMTLIIDVLMVYIPASGGKPPLNQLLPFMNNDSLKRLRRDSGESVMERVATGAAGSSKEEVPIRFKIPRIDMNYKLSSARCQNYTKAYSMVGFGDVILPGAFIVYILTFAVMTSNSVVLYSLFMLIWYIIGLVITYLVVQFAEKGQPALVFLLPCTVPTTILLSFIKKDFMSLWNHTWTDNLMENLRNIDDEELISVEPVSESKGPI